MQKYSLEFVLHTQNASSDALKSSLSEFADELEILDTCQPYARARDFQIRVSTDDPTLIFDLCAQFGRIKSVKVNEIK